MKKHKAVAYDANNLSERKDFQTQIPEVLVEKMEKLLSELEEHFDRIPNMYNPKGIGISFGLIPKNEKEFKYLISIKAIEKIN